MSCESDGTNAVAPSLWDRCAKRVADTFAALNQHRTILLAALAVIVLTGLVERLMGRSLLGPDGRLGLWESSIWSDECSQRLADPYSFSHIAHGIIFYAVLWWVARRIPVSARFLIAVVIEAGWEILENSPLIIERYRQVTIALGYEGDSVVNSVADVVMMALGFLLAFRCRPWIVVTLLVGMEVGCAVWIRDNLTLNVIMLLHPIDAIKAWQIAGRPPV